MKIIGLFIMVEQTMIFSPKKCILPTYAAYVINYGAHISENEKNRLFLLFLHVYITNAALLIKLNALYLCYILS